MSSLLHPIHGAREKCRPKHQVLILRCYPKFQKNVQEVKPNSSELSYLLYYASTRRSKLQKVGAFLEKKTASDVWRLKLGNVQVTLQILTSIIEKAPRDLTLYANSVLAILDTVLKSKDINMIEESIPTFEAYCKHVDTSALAADQDRKSQYLSIIEQYTSIATPEEKPHWKTDQSLPAMIRRRTITLRAIRATVGSDALNVEAMKQLNLVMPVVLENLALEKGGSLHSLQQRANGSEKQSAEIARKRRMSNATVSTVDEAEAYPAMASTTTADFDKAAEDEVRLLSVRCLRQIFAANTGGSRGQLRLATALILRFIASKDRPQPSSKGIRAARQPSDWATTLFEAIARWTPVQDRFVIVLTAMETLTRSPIVESGLEKQVVLATMIDWLLRSDINLIGLSVMDILLGLVQHTLLLLQLGDRGALMLPPQIDMLGIYKDTQETFTGATTVERGRQSSKELNPSHMRLELLAIIQKCISDLSTHIYYTDQITDMMTAILARLKPSVTPEMPSTAAAINDPNAATKAILDSASLQEDPSTDGFFSFATARVAALKAVKDILLTANSRKTHAGVPSESRSRVGVQVWEGTQWLVKDEDDAVRMAYVDAIVTWLKLETNRNDSLLSRDGSKRSKQGKRDISMNGSTNVAKRAVSSASKREPKPVKSTFLQLLHLAIFDNAVDMADSESEILLLHLLLATLVERLGVNAIRVGLPMVLNLQSLVLNDTLTTNQAKSNVASLVHSYLWAIAEKFDIESSRVGNEINAEISRRKRYGIWLDKARSPPANVSQIEQAAHSEKKMELSDEAIGSIKPFLNVTEFVDEIAMAYDTALISPPTSPPLSPGRVFSVPTLGFGYGYSLAPANKASAEDQVPQKVKDEMCGQWSREACIAAVAKESTGSMTGSKTGTSSGNRHHLAVAGGNGSTSGRDTPVGQEGATYQPGATGIVSGLGSLSKQRNFSAVSSLRELADTSSRDSTMRVSDLKKALAGGDVGMRSSSVLKQSMNRSRRSIQSSGSESMLSWNAADDNDDVMVDSTLQPHPERPTTPGSQHSKNQPTFHDQTTISNSTSDPRLGDDVPPVPKIPPALNLPGTYPQEVSPPQLEINKRRSQGTDTFTNEAPTRLISGSVRERNSGMRKSSRPASQAGGYSILNEKTFIPMRKNDLNSLLAGISSKGPPTYLGSENENRSKVIKPPY